MLALAQQLPQDVVAHIAHFLCTASFADPRPTLNARRQDAKSFVRVCRAWHVAGIAALWREVEVRFDTAGALQKRLEARPELCKHVESLMVNIEFRMGSGDKDLPVIVPALFASCPRLSRLEVIGRWP